MLTQTALYIYLFIHLNGVDARTLNISVFVCADNVNGSVCGVAIHERNICIINWLNMLFTIRFQPLKIHSTLQHHREIERKTKMCVDHKLFIRASASVLILFFLFHFFPARLFALIFVFDYFRIFLEICIRQRCEFAIAVTQYIVYCAWFWLWCVHHLFGKLVFEFRDAYAHTTILSESRFSR